MSDIVESFEYRGYQVEISHDYDAEDPLNGCDDVKLFAPHRKYRLGNVDYDAPKGTRIKVPVYMYDHGGLAVSTKPFSCPWDSGRLGTMFIENEDLKNIDTGNEMDYLMSVFDEWSQYVANEVYYVEIRKGGRIIESCGGIYGYEEAKQHGRELVNEDIVLDKIVYESLSIQRVKNAIQIARYA